MDETFAQTFLAEIQEVAALIDTKPIEKAAWLLAGLRNRGGRLFILGNGGGAANASHAVNDFRKIANIEAYTPTDNVAELTARINDDGWVASFCKWLITCRLSRQDVVLILSVGGGNYHTSPNIAAALTYSRHVGASIIGIVGRDGGHTARVADVCILVPTVHEPRITPHVEILQAVIWHLLVSHPLLAGSPDER